jgi:flagellar motor switch protein FliG
MVSTRVNKLGQDGPECIKEVKETEQKITTFFSKKRKEPGDVELAEKVKSEHDGKEKEAVREQLPAKKKLHSDSRGQKKLTSFFKKKNEV